MSRIVKKGATSQSLYFDVFDSTSSTGGRKTGLAYNTSNLIAYYVRNGAASVQITMATLAAASTAWSSGGFKEVDATGAPGIYRLDVPDAAFAAGAESVVVTILGATGMVMAAENVQLVAIDPQDTVRAGLTALPNAAAEATGGLFTRGSGAGQIVQDANGRIDVNLKSILGTLLTETAGQIAAGFKKLFDVAAPVFTLLSVNQTGDAYARLGAPVGASHAADVAAVKALLPAALIGGRIDASVGAMANDVVTSAAIATDAIGSAELAASAVTEIQSGLATASALATTDGKVDAIKAVADALPDAGALTSLAQASVLGTPASASIAGDIAAVPANGWDINLADHVDSGSMGQALFYAQQGANSADSKATNIYADTQAIRDLTDTLVNTSGKLWVLNDNGDPLPTANDIKTAVWSAQVGDYLGAGTTAETLYDGMTAAQAASTVTTKLDATLEDSTGYRFTAHALEQAPTGGSAPTAGEIAIAVWDEALADHTTDGTAGKALADTVAMAGTIEGRIGTPNYGDLAGDIAHAQGVIDEIDAKTTNLPADPADASDIAAAFSTLTSHGDGAWSTATGFATPGDVPAATDNANAVLAATYEGAETVQDHFRLARATLFGKANGLAGSTVHFRDLADSKNRLTATVDSDGNRTAIATDAT